LVTHINLKTMKTFNQVLDFLEAQQQEDKLNTNQLHLIIQTLTTFLNKEQMQEVENLFNQFKK
jgi:archaellum biogenesis ATPase FlaH